MLRVIPNTYIHPNFLATARSAFTLNCNIRPLLSMFLYKNIKISDVLPRMTSKSRKSRVPSREAHHLSNPLLPRGCRVLSLRNLDDRSRCNCTAVCHKGSIQNSFAGLSWQSGYVTKKSLEWSALRDLAQSRRQGWTDTYIVVGLGFCFPQSSFHGGIVFTCLFLNIIKVQISFSFSMSCF